MRGLAHAHGTVVSGTAIIGPQRMQPPAAAPPHPATHLRALPTQTVRSRPYCSPLIAVTFIPSLLAQRPIFAKCTVSLVGSFKKSDNNDDNNNVNTNDTTNHKNDKTDKNDKND